MATAQYIGVKEAAQVEGVSPETLLTRYRRKRMVLANDPEDARRKLVPVSALSTTAYHEWMKAQTCTALQGIAGQLRDGSSDQGKAEQGIALAPGSAKSLQPLLAFAVPTEREHALHDAIPPAIPHHQRAFVERWGAIVGDCTNGTWQKYRGQCLEGFTIRNNGDFIRAQAKLHDIGISTIHRKLALLKEINHNPDIPRERKMAEFWSRILPKTRPGRSGHTFFSDDENAWMREKLLNLYLTQAKLSVNRAYRLLLAEIDVKQRAWGAEHIYQKPTLNQCRTVLEKLDFPSLTLAREGDEAYRNKCSPYIKRRPPEHSGDFCVTDQKVFDILCRDSAWRLGRIWMVNFLDVASWRRLGGAYGPAVSGDMVMEAAAHMLSGACVPGHAHMDLGREFIGARFNGGIFRISGERLYAEAVGLWHRLGVEPVKAIGGNPQSKVIERWHGCIREFEQMFVTYTGRNPQERPPRLALLEKQAKEFKEGKAPPPPIPTIDQVIALFEWWCATEWNAGHRSKGRYLQGMTPDEAWNVKRPDKGFRTLTESELEYYTADRRFVEIARGGQVNLSIYGQTIEYIAPELFLHQGEEAEVLVSRRALDQVTVIYPAVGGTESCIAHLKEELPWGAESRAEVKVRLRCINSVKSILKRSVRAIGAAEGILAEAPLLPTRALLDTMVAQQIVNPRQLFGTSAPALPPLGHPETSSTEFIGDRLGLNKHQLTSEEVAEKALQAMEESP
jgi:hypothetical protein